MSRGRRSLAPRPLGRRWSIFVLAGCVFAVLAASMLGGESSAASSPITVTKSASATTIASGAQLSYTIVIKNTGGASLSNLTLTDQVNGLGVIQSPPALPQLTITSTKGSCTQGGGNGNLVTCSTGTLAGNETWTVTI